MGTSFGQTLQSWLIINKIGVVHSLFVPAVDHALKNELRKIAEEKLKLEEAINHDRNRRTINSAATDSSFVPGCEEAEIASSPRV
jgi:hypothetical protein